MKQLHLINDESMVDNLNSSAFDSISGSGLGSGISFGSGSGIGISTGSGIGTIEDFEPGLGLEAGSIKLRPMGFPVNVALEISWGSGYSTPTSKPSISVAFFETEGNGEFQLALEKSSKRAEWIGSYRARIRGTLVYYNVPAHGNETSNNGGLLISITPTEVPFDFAFDIPGEYRV